MDDARIEELSRSIKAHGVIQPIVVRKADKGYEIIAGERRWRASQMAGLLKVPVVVRDIPEDRLLAVALIENIQREDLNPIEEAHGVPPARRRIPHDAGSDRRRRRQGSLDGRERHAAAEAAARSARERRRRRTVDGPRARAAVAARRSRAAPASSREVVSRNLSVRETEGDGEEGGRAGDSRARNRRRTSTPAPPRRSFASPSAPASASSARARPDASKWTSRAKTSCIASTSS